MNINLGAVLTGSDRNSLDLYADIVGVGGGGENSKNNF